MSGTNDLCGNCCFWKHKTDRWDVIGECRRMPPRIIDSAAVHDLGEEPGWDDGTTMMATRFPVIGADEWCGKYKPNTDASAMRVREYRVDHEARHLLALATVVADADVDFMGHDPSEKLTQASGKMMRDIPHLASDIRRAAIGMTDRGDLRELLGGLPRNDAAPTEAGFQ